MVSVIPVVNLVTSLASFVILIIFLNSACDAVNALVAAADEALGQAPTAQSPPARVSEWD